jgi:GNAT superfamily N-acetyltransferase
VTITVREAVVDDAAAIARINIDGWRAGYRGQIADQILADLSVADREARWRERIGGTPGSSFGGRILVAERRGEVVGYCSFFAPTRDEDTGPDVAEIVAMYVHPNAWRSGIGAALMETALAELRSDPWRAVTLWVLDRNARAMAFYESFGFAPDGTEKVEARLGVVETRMRLTL